jgi:hypothetical protein
LLGGQRSTICRNDAPPVASKAVQSLMAAAAKPRHLLRLPRGAQAAI